MEQDEIERRIEAMRAEHRELDDAIAALGPGEQLPLARMKKRKLKLKDEMTQLSDQLIPDIIA